METVALSQVLESMSREERDALSDEWILNAAYWIECWMPHARGDEARRQDVILTQELQPRLHALQTARKPGPAPEAALAELEERVSLAEWVNSPAYDEE